MLTNMADIGLTMRATPVKFINLAGQSFAILPRTEYAKLVALARHASAPRRSAAGTVRVTPSAELLRTSVAGELVRRRAAVGLSQRALAKLAGIRFETLNRIEKTKATATTASIAKLDHALKRAERNITKKD